MGKHPLTLRTNFHQTDFPFCKLFSEIYDAGQTCIRIASLLLTLNTFLPVMVSRSTSYPFFAQNPTLFLVYDPDSLRTIFQLRLGLSPLRSHKKPHNFIHTPSDICPCKHGVEDIHHFIISCPFYDNLRAAPVNDMIQRNSVVLPGNEIDLYLYGHPSLNDSDNNKILSCTIKYLKEIHRFNKS